MEILEDGGGEKTKPIQTCPFVKPLRGKLRAGSEQRRMEPKQAEWVLVMDISVCYTFAGIKLRKDKYE